MVGRGKIALRLATGKHSYDTGWYQLELVHSECPRNSQCAHFSVTFR